VGKAEIASATIPVEPSRTVAAQSCLRQSATAPTCGPNPASPSDLAGRTQRP